MSDRIEITYINPDNLVLMEDNPNIQTDAVFNNLVENIREIGMVEPIMVAPLHDDSGAVVPDKYKIVSGAHRYEACKMLDYEEIPCIVQENFDEDMAKFQLVRMNVLKGKLDPVKFTKLYNNMAEKYGTELTKTAMGLVDEKAFQNLYVKVRDELPSDLKKKMDEARGDIKTVDDLSRVLNEMFSKYGDTLKNNFMIFQYGGKSHVWVMMDDALRGLVIENILPQIYDGGYDIADFFKKLITEHGQEVMDSLEATVFEPDDTF